MCQQCLDAFEELWPELPEDDRMTFLWECTAFPIGNNARERLGYFLSKCGKDMSEIIALNSKEFEEALVNLGRLEG